VVGLSVDLQCVLRTRELLSQLVGKVACPHHLGSVQCITASGSWLAQHNITGMRVECRDFVTRIADANSVSLQQAVRALRSHICPRERFSRFDCTGVWNLIGSYDRLDWCADLSSVRWCRAPHDGLHKIGCTATARGTTRGLHEHILFLPHFFDHALTN